MIIEKEYALYNAILHPYIGEDLELGRMYNSPLPDHDDSSASFQVFPGTNDFSERLFWKDWGYGQHLGHRPIHLLRHLTLDPERKPISEKEAKLKIARLDFTVGDGIKSVVKRSLSHLSSYNYNIREYNFFVTTRYLDRSLLIKYKVAGTRALYNDAGDEVYNSANGPMTFTYMGPDGKFQLYRPQPKWLYRSTGPAFLIGYEQLPYTGRVLLLMSGMKDGLATVRATGWPFLCGAGENDFRTYIPYMDELKERFDYIGVCQDPDPAGQAANVLLSKELDIPIFDFPYPNNYEDIDDLIVKYGPNQLRKAFYTKLPFKL